MQWAAMNPEPPVRSTFISIAREAEKFRLGELDVDVGSSRGSIKVADGKGLERREGEEIFALSI